MAAYAALVSLINDLELIPNHPTHSFSFDEEQITSLSQTVEFLIDFLESYDTHGCSREAAQDLESQIAYVAHAAHDVVESHVVHQIQAGSTLPRKSISYILHTIKIKLMQFGSTLGGKPISYFLPDLQKAIDNMDSVKREATLFKEESELKTEHPAFPAPTSSSEPQTSGKNLMVGFDAFVLRLMEMLTGEPPNQQVIPIVGMGGIGKTTLAKNVYRHFYIEQHFDVRLWATISHEYSAESILTQLLSRESKSNTGVSVNELGEQLHKKLWGRRYLVVLDDMWSLDAWDEIQMFLPDNVNGSRVVVTTRLSNLAANLSSFSPFEMKFLDDDKSWELFCMNVFGDDDCPFELEEIGKKIVKRCKGLPLSIVVIGGHLRKSSITLEYWEKVVSYMNPISSLAEDEQCLNIISFSYHRLPPHLKPFLLYMAFFHEDEIVGAFELINFWVGEGFVRAERGLSLEEVAEDYLNDLIARNLIIVDHREWNGKVSYCFVHDIVRELCLKVCKKEKFLGLLEDAITQGIDSRERRIAIPMEMKLSPSVSGALQSAPALRSIICQGGGLLGNYLPVDFSLLRVSGHVCTIHLQKDAHFKLVNLRCLDFLVQSRLSYSIPSSISACWNLQTLIILGFYGQMTLPSEIWEMPQLRNLEFYRVCLPDPVPVPVPTEGSSSHGESIVLRNLQTFMGVENLRLSEEVCRKMPNVKQLVIEYNDNFRGDYCFQNLGRFHNLKSLTCEVDDGDSKQRDVVLSFAFPASLEELSLCCPLNWEDLTVMIKSLPRLGFLELSYVDGSEWNLDEEEFGCLKILKICNCVDLTYLNANSSHFPVLESLYIWETPKLSEIPSDIGEIATLRKIRLHDCGVSIAVSATRIVVEQERFGNLDIQLHASFSETEEVERLQRMVQEERLTTNNLHVRGF